MRGFSAAARVVRPITHILLLPFSVPPKRKTDNNKFSFQFLLEFTKIIHQVITVSAKLDILNNINYRGGPLLAQINVGLQLSKTDRQTALNNLKYFSWSVSATSVKLGTQVEKR